VCDDFSEPVSREEFKGFMVAHEANKRRIQPDVKYDVVFLGDETTEGWNGKLLGLPFPGGKKIQKFWDETFTSDGGGDIEGLALGIAGDSVRRFMFAVKSFCLLEALDSYNLSCYFHVCILLQLGSQPTLAATAWRITTHTQAECLVALDWYQRLGSRWL
jgi:hypothetical protein